MCCVAAAAPVAWHLIASLKTPAELVLTPPTLIPHAPTLSNYRELFERRPFLRYYLNSVTIASMSAFLCVGAAALAAFMLARAGDSGMPFEVLNLSFVLLRAFTR